VVSKGKLKVRKLESMKEKKSEPNSVTMKVKVMVR